MTYEHCKNCELLSKNIRCQHIKAKMCGLQRISEISVCPIEKDKKLFNKNEK